MIDEGLCKFELIKSARPNCKKNLPIFHVYPFGRGI